VLLIRTVRATRDISDKLLALIGRLLMDTE